MQVASRNASALAQRDYHNTGLGALNWLSDLVDQIEQDEQAYTALIDALKQIHLALLQAPKQFYWSVKSSFLKRWSRKFRRYGIILM